MRDFKFFGLMFFCLMMVFSSCSSPTSEDQTDDTVTDTSDVAEPMQLSRQDELRLLGDSLIGLIMYRDFPKVAEFVHPERGLRFFPYGHVDTSVIPVFSPVEVQVLNGDHRFRHWGYFDGTGDSIRFTFGEYFQRFVMRKDFREADSVAVNQKIGHGNTLFNLDDVYPNADFVEYHIKGNEERFSGMDWGSLILVFEEIDGEFYLIGIMNDEWTI